MGLRLYIVFSAILLCGLSTRNVAFALTGAVLGQGYKTALGVTTTSCFANSVTDRWMEDAVMSNPQSDLEFQQVSSYDELKKLMDISGSVSGNAGGWGAKVGGGFIDQLGRSSRSVNIIYAFQLKYNTTLNLQLAKYRNRTEALTLLKGAVSNWYTSAGNTPQLIYNSCGDKYSSEVSSGVLLLVAITMNFGSSAAKNAFNAEVAVSGSVGVVNAGISGALSMAENSTGSGTSITVSAQQFGGNTMRLQDVTLGEPDSSGMYQIQKCGSDSKDPKKCERLVENIITYSQTLESQITDSNGQIDRNNLFYSDPVYTPYEFLFGPVGAPDIKAQQAALSLLRDQYDGLARDIRIIDEYLLRANEVFGGSGTLSSISGGALLGELSTYKQVLVNNKKVYDSNIALKSCFKSTVSCDTAKREINAGISSKPEYAKSAAYLKYIKENVFSINDLLTIKDVTNPQKPEFKYVSCDLLPLKPETGSWTNALSGCGVSGGGRPVTRHIVSAGVNSIEVEEFSYSIKMGDREYQITYPKTVLYASEFAEYMVNDDTQIPKVKYAECKNGVCSDTQDILPEQIANYSEIDAFYMRQEDFIKMYPDILY
jgi:hypothetical protein